MLSLNQLCNYEQRSVNDQTLKYSKEIVFLGKQKLPRLVFNVLFRLFDNHTEFSKMGMKFVSLARKGCLDLFLSSLNLQSLHICRFGDRPLSDQK